MSSLNLTATAVDTVFTTDMTNTYTIVFEDETELNGLTFEEVDKAMEKSLEDGNRWTRIYPEQTDYKPC